MRLLLGIVVLFAGLLGIGFFWGAHQAQEIEHKVQKSADAIHFDLEKSGDIDTKQITAKVLGRDLTLYGTVESDEEKAALLTAFSRATGVRQVRSSLELPPIASPYPFAIDKAGTVRGHVPSKEIRDALSTALGLSDIGALRLAQGMPDDNWPTAMMASAKVLETLLEGRMFAQDRQITFVGKVTFDHELREIVDQLERLPQGYTPLVSIEVLDDGKPFSIEFKQQNGALTAVAGKLPADFPASRFGPIARGYTSDTDRAFGQNLDTAIATLASVNAQNLAFTKDTLQLTATVNTPQDARALELALKEALPQHAISLSLEVLDDGVPAFVTLRYAASEGIRIGGKLPEGFQAWLQRAAPFKSATYESDAYTARFNAPKIETLGQTAVDLAPWLPEFEHLLLRQQQSDLTIEGITTYGVDIGQLETELQAAFKNAALRLRAADPASAPAEGTKRVNAITATTEVFRGAWLPQVSFSPSLENCNKASKSALETHKINFVTGAAQLDARSMRAINAISAIVYHCTQKDGLELLITGHTDNQGQPEANQKLSESRAQAVGSALLQRAIDADLLRIFGAGDTDPIADNTTAEGRAANRRTSLHWQAVSQNDAHSQNTQTK